VVLRDQLVPLGYAKPVPVDFNRLRNPKKQMAFVAGRPGANFVMGLGWMLFGLSDVDSGFHQSGERSSLKMFRGRR
jgi:hypothetical protein